jgi:hypothetical protein
MQVPEIETGPGAQVTIDGLHRVKNSRYKHVWAKPDADLAAYEKITFGPVEVHYRRKPRGRRDAATSPNFALTTRQMEDLKKELEGAFAAELTKAGLYQLVEEPGPEVLRIDISIIDLIVKVPTQSTTASQQTYTSSTADMTLIMELRDSTSGEILARAADRQDARAPGFASSNDLYHSNSARDRGAVRRVFKGWAEILRAQLEEIRSIESNAAVRD